MSTTNKRLLQANIWALLNHGSEFQILWDTFGSQIAKLWFSYDRTIAIDRRRSQTIVEVCFHMIANDRRTFCDPRSAIRDRLRSYGNQPLDLDTVSGGLWHSTRGSSTVELDVYWVIILTKNKHQGQKWSVAQGIINLILKTIDKRLLLQLATNYCWIVFFFPLFLSAINKFNMQICRKDIQFYSTFF